MRTFSSLLAVASSCLLVSLAPCCQTLSRWACFFAKAASSFSFWAAFEASLAAIWPALMPDDRSRSGQPMFKVDINKSLLLSGIKQLDSALDWDG